jgi:hypothetical protein
MGCACDRAAHCADCQTMIAPLSGGLIFAFVLGQALRCGRLAGRRRENGVDRLIDLLDADRPHANIVCACALAVIAGTQVRQVLLPKISANSTG